MASDVAAVNLVSYRPSSPDGSPASSPSATSLADPATRKIINRIAKATAEGRTFYSFEFFPPKTEEAVENLMSRIDRLALLGPMFMDVTWGAGGSTSDLTLDISSNIQNFSGSEVMMHLTCTNMGKEAVRTALNKAKANGIRNILALRGDPPKGAESWEAVEDGFAHAVDLVRFIRREHGDYFGIAVAGYPEMHLTAASLADDIKHLKEKVDAGADFVVTQLFYDCDLFLKFVELCREAGIMCPVIPGIMPIQNYNGFIRMTSFCKTFVPKDITDALEPIKDDDALVKQYGIDLAVRMCKKLLVAGVKGLHFYTLNLERSVVKILEGLNLIAVEDEHIKAVPWVPSRLSRRAKEDVRPIFWANRPHSYLTRTATWDEFPNGRWGDSRSPAFGDLSDYHLMNHSASKAERRTIWGESLTQLADVYNVFARYVEGNVPKLPWCETTLSKESFPLQSTLAKLNRSGFLTINSQPRVNGARSDDPAVGWGGHGGYVYQKAYMEFFTSPENYARLKKEIAKFPSLVYHAVDMKGLSETNAQTDHACAVTWGVFPAREIIQPTIVDPRSFPVWKNEAFALWRTTWGIIYPAGSPSANLLRDIQETFVLMNIVDNDFVNGDIFAVFKNLMA